MQINRNEEHLNFLANSIINNNASFEKLAAQFSEFIAIHPELLQLTWLDANNRLRYRSHSTEMADLNLISAQTLEYARQSKLPNYSQPTLRKGSDSEMHMDYVLPLMKQENYVGCLIITYKMSAILDTMVPWWFAKDNQITLTDIDDHVLAQRADGGTGHHVHTYHKNIELPGLNLILKTDNVKNLPVLLSKYLFFAVILLATALVWSLWALWRDIVRRIKVESLLRGQVAFRVAMENSSMTGLRVRSLDGRLVYVNPAFCKLLGYSEEQLLSFPTPMPFWVDESVEKHNHDQILNKKANRAGVETVYRHADGHRIPVVVFESPLLNADGLQTGWMGSVLDISERKLAEKILRDSEERFKKHARLSTMGELSSVMAHELNQPLAAISSYATGVINMVNNSKLDDKLLQHALMQIQMQAQRAGQIIRSVHDFVIRRDQKRIPMQLSDVLTGVFPLIELQAKSYLIWLQVHIDEPLPEVLIDPTSIEQVLLNLTRNALQSMQELTAAQRTLCIDVIKSGHDVKVAVIDHGKGIVPEMAEKLFSPFFSTKAEGMGMGLNICRSIIEFHGGHLSYEPNPQGGSIFSFTLPVVNVSD